MRPPLFQRRSVMEQSTFPLSRNLSLERLVTDALGEIKRLGYSRRSRGRYRATWEHLIEFCGRNGLGDQFSGELAVRFLEETTKGTVRTASISDRRRLTGVRQNSRSS